MNPDEAASISASAEQVFALLRERRSIRRFLDEPIDRAVLESLIEAAAWAPSASNRQDWFFTIVTSVAIKTSMAEAVRRRWESIIEANRDLGMIDEVVRYVSHFGNFASAPAVVVVSARRPDEVQKHFVGVEEASAVSGSAASAAMAAQNLMLAAHALGLGTCCMTGALAARDELARLIGLGRRYEIVCLIALGKPAESPPAPPRKPISEIARFLE